MSNHSASEQEFLNKLNELIENHLENEHYGVIELARDMGMSRSNLHRKVKALTKITASQYLRQYRLKKASEMLQQTSDTVSEVAYKVGFSSPSYFVKCFHDYYGYSPGEVGKRSTDDIEQTSQIHFGKKKLIAVVSGIFVLIIIVVVLFVVVKPFSFQQKELEKTIAVLPPTNYSPDSTDTETLLNGLMLLIISNLEKIGDLELRSSTTMNQYTGTKKSLKEIAKEVDANYIVTLSGLKLGKTIQLAFQLTDAISDKTLDSKPYEKEINEVPDYIEILAEIAYDIANKIKAKITPTERKEIEKHPTENMAAFNKYSQGLAYLEIARGNITYQYNSETHNTLKISKKYMEEAVALDSTFVEALVELSGSYITYFANFTNNLQLHLNYLDSGRIYAEKALEYDPGNYRATRLMALYYIRMGMEKEAEEWGKIRDQLKQDLNLEEYELYLSEFSSSNYYNTIKYYYKFLETKPEEFEPRTGQLRTVYNSFVRTGYPELAKSVAQKVLTRSNDSIGYWQRLGNLNFLYENDTSFQFIKKAYEKDSTDINTIDYLCQGTSYTRNFSDAYYYLQKLKEAYEARGDTLPLFYIYGYIYLQYGYKNEAEKHFNADIKKYTQAIELNIQIAQGYWSHAILASIYSIKGEKEKALNYWKQIQKREKIFRYSWIKYFKNHPMFDNIRGEPEFQKTLADLEAKWEKEHERVGELLRDLGEIE